MITLGIDTSLDDVSFAILDGLTVLAEYNENIGRNLADKISEIFLELFKEAKVKADDFERCGIVVGPGSFTGLRIGIAFAKGLFANSNAKITPISSLECIARSCAKIGNISVILDARQGEVFFAKFNNENGFVCLCEDKRIALEEALKNENIIEAPNFAKNRGEIAAKVAAESEKLLTIDDIFPNYMQVSYAERCKK